MNHYDDEILRLNKKIKQLIWRNEQSEKITFNINIEFAVTPEYFSHVT